MSREASAKGGVGTKRSRTADVLLVERVQFRQPTYHTVPCTAVLDLVPCFSHPPTPCCTIIMQGLITGIRPYARYHATEIRA